MNDAGFEHAGGAFRFVTRFDRLAANMTDAKGKDALRWHKAVGLGTGKAHEKTAVGIERLTGGHF